jgi:type VI secretion system protein ImpA
MISSETLLLPISETMPAGVDLRNPTRRPELYDAMAALRDARRREDAGDPDHAPDWAAAERLCGLILSKHSKDLEAAAGLAEASVRNDGFAGLAASGALIAGLVRRFWPALFPAPAPDEPDLAPEAVRLVPLRHLVAERGRLIGGIHLQVLFALDDGTAFTLADCRASKAWTALRPEERSKRLSGLPPDQRAVREKAPNGRLWGDLRAGIGAQNAVELAQTRDAAAAALVAWQDVAKAIDEQAGDSGFTCPDLLNLLADVERTLNEIMPPSAAPSEPAVELVTDTREPTPHAGPAAPRVLADRDDALRQLEDIAAFFRRTEPFSPVAYTLEEAVRRARLPWPEWLAETVPDKMQRDTILNRLGLRPDGG